MITLFADVASLHSGHVAPCLVFVHLTAKLSVRNQPRRYTFAHMYFSIELGMKGKAIQQILDKISVTH